MLDEPSSRYSGETFIEVSRSQQPVLPPESPPQKASNRSPKRINRIALWLAIATIFSTFLAGVGAWSPLELVTLAWRLDSLMPFRQALLANWLGGLQFSLALMAILVAHELGHYVLTIVYRVPSTPPLFIPFPVISPIGTMGAVIMMQSGTADRKQIFDIGLAGPIAGLVVAFPIIIYGLYHPTPIQYASTDISIYFGQPLLIQWLAQWFVPDDADRFVQIANTQVSPFLMAGWVGLLVTGLNMMPLGQLDGGHVTFGLVGNKAIYVARGAAIATLVYMAYSQVFAFAIMFLLAVLLGLRHPPSSDDTKQLGLPRQIVGWASLVLPILCIPGQPWDLPPL